MKVEGNWKTLKKKQQQLMDQRTTCTIIQVHYQTRHLGTQAAMLVMPKNPFSNDKIAVTHSMSWLIALFLRPLCTEFTMVMRLAAHSRHGEGVVQWLRSLTTVRTVVSSDVRTTKAASVWATE